MRCSTRCLSILCLLMLAMLMTGCGSTPTVTTRIDPATVAISDHLDNRGLGEKHQSKITITPATQPAAASSPVEAPATRPSAISFSDLTPIQVKFNGRTITAPAGSSVAVETTDDNIAPELLHDRTASAAGSTLRTDGPIGDFKATAPDVKLTATNDTGPDGASLGGGGGAAGGASSFDWQAPIISAAAAGAKWGWLIGLLVMVGGLAWVLISHFLGTVTDMALFWLIEGLGLAIIIISVVAEKYPWMFLLLFIGGIMAIIAYEVWWKKKEVPSVTVTTTPATTVTTTAAGIPSAPAVTL